MFLIHSFRLDLVFFVLDDFGLLNVQNQLFDAVLDEIERYSAIC